MSDMFKERLAAAASDMGFDREEDLTEMLADHGLIIVDKENQRLLKVHAEKSLKLLITDDDE